MIVSPDVGGLKLASAYAEALGATLAIVGKRRKSPTETEALNVIGEVEGKNVLLVDDLTETAGTLTNAAALLKKQGAKDIYAGVSHAVFTEHRSQTTEEFGDFGTNYNQQHARPPPPGLPDYGALHC